MSAFSSPSYGNRIIYIESGIPNVSQSAEVFMLYVGSDIKHFRSYIDTVNNRWYIREESKSELVLQGTASSRHKLMIKAKQALVNLGVKFDAEVRKKRKAGDDVQSGS